MTTKSNIVIGLILIILGFSLAFPALINSLDNTEQIVFEQTEGEQTIIKGSLETIITDNSNPQNYVNITIINTESGSSANTGILEEEDSTILSLENGDVTITNIEVTSQTTALIMYEYPTYIGWPSGAKILFENVTTILIIMLVLVISGGLVIIFEVLK